MARSSERGSWRRVIGARGIKQVATAAAASVVMLAAFAAPHQNWSGQDALDAIADAYNVGYLMDMAEKTQDPILKKFAESQVAATLQKLRSILSEANREAWDAYRTCLAMQQPTTGNSGKLLKDAKMFEHRDQAIFGLQSIPGIFGGPSMDSALSAPTGEAADAAKGAALDVANEAAKGTALDGMFKAAGTALSVADAATKLYQLSQAVGAGLDAIDARSAADAATTQCRKPPDPDLPDGGTPELKPHGPKPHQPDRPPPPPDPQPPTPQQHIPAGKALMNWAAKQGQGG